MANYADVTLRIYGNDVNKLNNKFSSFVSNLSAEYIISELREDFIKDEDKIELIDNFLKNGDKRFSFMIFNEDDNFLELVGQSAWAEPYDFIKVLSKLYNDINIYYLVYEPCCEVYQTNDMDGTVFSESNFGYALDVEGCYGPVTENTLLEEAIKYYETDFFDSDDVWDFYNSAIDPHIHKDDDEYFNLLKLERIVY